jgi:hypothetical protein
VFSRSAGWATVRGRGYYLGGALLATRRGATLSMDVATSGLGIMATTCPSCGAIKVYVDGVDYGKFSLRSSRTHYREVVYWSDNGEEGFFGEDGDSSSTIAIKVTSTGRPVIIDGIVLDVCPGCS